LKRRPAEVYGAVLGALHVLQGVAWIAYKDVVALVTGPDVACWPLVPCEALRGWLTPWWAKRLVAVYIGLGVAAAIAFARGRGGKKTLFAASVVGLFVYALDYRMRFNQTYMFGWVLGAFLLAKDPLASVRALVVSFYFWAGTLKLNREWLSGAALYAKPWLVPERLVPAACAYVVALELGLVFGLLSRRRWVRHVVLAQLAAFHVVSVTVVGWFYPLLMFGLLSVFVLEDEARVERRTFGVFALFQIAPYAFGGDPALTGEGRLFALHMFDARVVCRGVARVDGAGFPLVDDADEARTRCDPIVILARLRRLCREHPGATIDAAVDARRTSETSLRPLVRIDDACRAAPVYSVWRRNPWIVSGRPSPSDNR